MVLTSFIFVLFPKMVCPLNLCSMRPNPISESYTPLCFPEAQVTGDSRLDQAADGTAGKSGFVPFRRM